MTEHITDQLLTDVARKMGPDWQAGRHEPRDPEAALITPSLVEMAAAPGETQTKYTITYQRVGRHGGRNGSRPPAPLTTWAVTEAGLIERIEADIAPYLLSGDVEAIVDLESLTGRIYAGFQNAGTFTLEVVQVAEGGASDGR